MTFLVLGQAGILIGFGILGVVMAAIIIVAKLTVVGNPSEMLVISGRQQSDGKGYRTLIGGRTLVIPIFEKVSRLSLRNMQVQLEVNAQSGGGTMVPITVTGVANVKVSSDPSERASAIERFLDQRPDVLQQVARETLEGGIRAVIGKMTPQEMVEDRDKFVATVMQEVVDDFRKLGLVIDSVNVQNIHDSQQYLESISRKATAEVIAAARKAEAERSAEASIKEAEAAAAARRAKAEREAEARTAEAVARQKAEQARLVADKAIAEAQNDLRIRQAELARDAAVKETEQQEAAARAEEARLLATEVQAARAQRDVAKAAAEGAAAKLLEEGKARAASIELIGRAIHQHPEALKVMLVEQMPKIVHEVSESVKNIALGDVTVIDGGQGHALAGAALSRARVLSETLATIDDILGIDIRQVSRGIAGRLAASEDGHTESQPSAKTGRDA